jgi:VIT1/CCC1 family predicted Fe2+/Mn2+ transporter
MKRALGLILFMALVAGFSSSATAQDASNVSESLDTLRSQLLDAQAKEAELEAREHQLDEDLKPENIERSLAGIGSTKPEELRESRRRQLSIERDGVRAQLKLVKTSRERLESVIRLAEAQAYQQNASGSGSAPLLQQTLSGKHLGWIVGIAAAVGGILGIVMLVILARKRART